VARISVFRSVLSVQSAVVSVPQGHRLDCNWYSVITGAATGGRSTTCRQSRVAPVASANEWWQPRRFDRDDAIRTVGQGSGHSGVTGLLAWLAPVLCRDDRFFAGFLPHGTSVDGGREEFEESAPNCRSSSAIRLLCWATVASSSVIFAA